MKGTEAEYIIPLRKELMKVAKYDRIKKASKAVRQFLIKHTKSKNVILGPVLNLKLHEKGKKNILPRVYVKVIKDEEKYKAELIGFPIILEKDKKEAEDKGKKIKKKEEKAPAETKEKTEAKKGEKLIETKEKGKEEKIPSTDKAPEKLPKKEEKIRHESIVTKTEKPKHEKKK